MLLKMDIEGCEWSVLANADNNVLKKFDQIVIEFHEILNYKREYPCCLKALDNLNKTHQLVYLHANNNSPVDIYGSMVTPNLLEATFVLRNKYNFEESKLVLPTDLDCPNIPNIPEIRMGIWNV